MFWQKTSDKSLELSNKFKFIVTFDNTARGSPSSDNVTLYQNYNQIPSPTRDNFLFQYYVKKIDAPKINFEFERAYANQYIDYFQNGQIYWEPINITFVDYNISNRPDNIKSILSTYIEFLNSYSIDVLFSDNRTGIVDLPTLCNNITIMNYTLHSKPDYPSGKNLNIEQNKETDSQKQGLKDKDKTSWKSATIEDALSKGTIKVTNSFKLINPRLSKIDFGSFDYGSDDFNEISITVIPENVIFGKQEI